MYLKYFFIQNTKALFSFLKLHVLFHPFSGLFRNLAYLSMQGKWINQNKEIGFNDFFTWNRNRDKRLNLYASLIYSLFKYAYRLSLLSLFLFQVKKSLNPISLF